MYTKKDLIASLETEVRIIKHLASQLGEDHYEFKPTDSQRTVLELLQYLSFVAGTQTRAIIEGDVEVFKNNAFAAKSLTADEFEAKMERFGESLEHRMEAQADALEEKADALCDVLEEADYAETKMQKSIPGLSELNLLDMDSHSMKM